MLFFLFGPDTLRSRAKLSQIQEEYKKRHGGNISISEWDCAHATFAQIQESLRTISIFREKKLIVISFACENPEVAGMLYENRKLLENEENIIVFFEEEVQNASKCQLLKFLKTKAKTQEFPLLTGTPLRQWIAREFEKYGVKPEALVIQRIEQEIGNDLWKLTQVVQAIATYVLPSKTLSAKQDLSFFVKSEISADIFLTVEAIASGNQQHALKSLYAHLKKGDSPLYIASMIMYEFRVLLEIKEMLEKGVLPSQVAKKAHLHPYVIQKSMRIAERFTYEELKEAYRRIFQLDVSLKTGKVDPAFALYDFVLKTAGAK